MILACSGSSNVGQLANLAAREMTKEGFGRFGCLAGIGAGLSGFVQSAIDADEVLLIDGCPLGCGKGIFENQGVPLRKYLVITELGIEKIHTFDLEPGDIEKVTNALREMFLDGAQAEKERVA